MSIRILFVSPYLPSAVRVRPYQWIRALTRQGHRVRLVALRPPEDRWNEEVPVGRCCEQVTVFPLSRVRTLRNGAAAVFRDVPLQAAYSLHPAAERLVADEAKRCDVVHVEHLRGALLARRVQGVPCVFDAVDSITALFDQAAHQAPSWRQRLMARADLARTARFEARLLGSFDRTLVTSRRDADAFRRLAGPPAADRLVTIPNGVDFDYFRPSEGRMQPDTVLFTGKMSYHANVAAALRLATQVMPRIWQRRPGARLVVAGKDPSPVIRSLGRDPRVSVTGFVDDLRPFFRAATVLVAPLVYGTGIQNKVLEAMACGVPVVASPPACDGLDAQPGCDLLVGADDAELAAHAVAVMQDRTLRRALVAAGRRYVEQYHDWQQMACRLIEVYEGARAVYGRCA